MGESLRVLQPLDTRINRDAVTRLSGRHDTQRSRHVDGKYSRKGRHRRAGPPRFRFVSRSPLRLAIYWRGCWRERKSHLLALWKSSSSLSSFAPRFNRDVTRANIPINPPQWSPTQRSRCGSFIREYLRKYYQTVALSFGEHSLFVVSLDFCQSFGQIHPTSPCNKSTLCRYYRCGYFRIFLENSTILLRDAARRKLEALWSSLFRVLKNLSDLPMVFLTTGARIYSHNLASSTRRSRRAKLATV